MRPCALALIGWALSAAVFAQESPPEEPVDPPAAVDAEPPADAQPADPDPSAEQPAAEPSDGAPAPESPAESLPAPPQTEPAPMPLAPRVTPGPAPPPPPQESSEPSAAVPEGLQQPAGPSKPPPVAAAPSSWSFALTTGYYRPRLGTLNRILRDTSLTIMQDPNFLLPRNQNFPFEKRNIAVTDIEGGMTYGVDAFYHTGGPHSFGISFSSWRGETIGHDTISLFLRSNVPAEIVPRSARYNLVLDRIFLEWRYHLVRNAEGRGVYVNIGLIGVSMAFLTMDALVKVENPILPFASVSSDESFGWGYTSRFGIGGDYPITSWLSIGGQANYVVATITKMRVTRHFLAGFPELPVPEPFSIRPGIPLPQLFFAPLDGKTVQYTNIVTVGDVQEKPGTLRDLVLELSGVETLLKLTVHF